MRGRRFTLSSCFVTLHRVYALCSAHDERDFASGSGDSDADSDSSSGGHSSAGWRGRILLGPRPPLCVRVCICPGTCAQPAAPVQSASADCVSDIPRGPFGASKWPARSRDAHTLNQSNPSCRRPSLLCVSVGGGISGVDDQVVASYIALEDPSPASPNHKDSRPEQQPDVASLLRQDWDLLSSGSREEAPPPQSGAPDTASSGRTSSADALALRSRCGSDAPPREAEVVERRGRSRDLRTSGGVPCSLFGAVPRRPRQACDGSAARKCRRGRPGPQVRAGSRLSRMRRRQAVR